MRRVHRAFKAFDDLDRDLAQFVELRIFPSCDQFLVPWSCVRRTLAHLTRHSKTLILLSCKGTEPFWILRLLLDQVRLSVPRSCGTWLDTWTCEVMRCWCFEWWTSHASLLVCFWLSVRAVRYYSHLGWPCKVFHSWGGKTCSLLIDRSHDARLESRDTIGVVMLTEVGKCDRSRDIRSESVIRPESLLMTRVRHTTKVTHMTGVVIYLHYKHV
jgi:hypothetical protein